jgi:hypothetical protein
MEWMAQTVLKDKKKQKIEQKQRRAMRRMGGKKRRKMHRPNRKMFKQAAIQRASYGQ